MKITALLNRDSSAVHRHSAGIVTARLSKPLPVKAAVEVEVDIDVKADDVITVVENEEGTSINLFFLSDIDSWGCADPDVLMATIKEYRPKFINLYIGSYGGDCNVAMRDYDLLRASGAYVTAYLTGICASAATMIACAADKVVMSRQCLYMTHSAGTWSGFVDGDSIQSLANVLASMNDVITDIYARKTGRSAEDMQQYVKGETWLSADRALAAGFVDEVVENFAIDLDLPSDVKEVYETYDDSWYMFFDKSSGELKNEQMVFTACLNHAKSNGHDVALSAEIAPNNSENDMEFINKMIDALAERGYIKNDQSEAAKNEAESKAPELMSSLVKEVKAQLEADTPETVEAPEAEAPKPLAEQIAELSEEDIAALAERIGVKAEDTEDTKEVEELTAKVEELTGELTAVKTAISASRAGRAPVPTPSNGDPVVEANKEEKSKCAKDSATYAFTLSQFKRGNISAELFESTTGHPAPSK